MAKTNDALTQMIINGSNVVLRVLGFGKLVDKLSANKSDVKTGQTAVNSSVTLTPNVPQ